MSNQIRDVKLTELLVEQISSLYMSENCSDITLYVEGQKIPAHSSVIGARCEYLNKFFATSLNEPNQTKFELDVPLEPFKVLLEYFYTSQINLTKIKDVEVLIQIFNLVEEYCLFNLKPHFEKYCIEILSVPNVFQFLKAARTYDLKELEKESLNLIESYPDQILASDSFKKISKELLKEILTNDSFCACSELYIFNSVIEWSKKTKEDIESVLHLINLSEIPLKELLKLRNSETLTEKKIFDALAKQVNGKPLQRPGFRKCNENVATSKFNAKTIKGFNPSELLNGNCSLYDDITGFTRHTINQSNHSGIIVELGKIFNINHIKMLLWDRNNRRYSYFIEISTDKEQWKRIIDYSSFSCRSWQYLYFSAKPVKFIKIVGTHSSANNYFDIVTLEAYYKENIPVFKNGFFVPKKNVALDSLGATVEKAIYLPVGLESLINDDPYHGGVCYEILHGRNITIKLSQPFYIDSIKLLLDDSQGNLYKFYVETSLNYADWEEVGNRRNRFVTSWQSFRFRSRPVLYIRIVAIDTNNYNKFFRIKHFECPIQDQWKTKYLLASLFCLVFGSAFYYIEYKK